jgi:preprotein translocase subunit SecA
VSATATLRAPTAPVAPSPATPPTGLRLGRAVPYPERQVREPGVVEGALRGFVAVLPHTPQTLLRLRARRVCALAARYATEADSAAAAPAEAVAALRLRLRDGLGSDAMARAFALVRAVAARTLGLRPYDVQLMAAWAMLRGHMAELATGEGKTLAASLAAATAALAGRTVHVITVNDYLAERDHEFLSHLYKALGLTAGLVIHGQSPEERRAAYACDIVYASNKELVFDYLRDQMRRRGTPTALHGRVARLDGRPAHEDSLLLRGLDFAIVDEADSVLIDEARTPLIISSDAPSAADPAACQEALELVAGLVEGEDYTIDRSDRRIDMTPSGRRRADALAETLGSRLGGTVQRSELVVRALTARLLFERGVHYLLRDGKVCIIDEYTGRIMPDRFWNDGLHQMIEAKEAVEASGHRASVARITYQRFFARYHHLCGMSGTLAEVTGELLAVYGVGVARIPTHNRCRRTEHKTIVTRSAEAKWHAIAEHASVVAATGRPVLVGTRSVADSERASALLQGQGVRHRLLNAAQDAAEAAVVAEAGGSGRVTIATNMAGRGTDIKLEPGVNERGGLAVILSDRHDAGRIDRQLAGRGARQGDAGSFIQILSLDDALMDPLRTNTVGRTLLSIAVTNQRLAAALFGFLQKRAERRHRLIRRELMRFEAKLQASLSFAGRPD